MHRAKLNKDVTFKSRVRDYCECVQIYNNHPRKRSAELIHKHVQMYQRHRRILIENTMGLSPIVTFPY